MSEPYIGEIRPFAFGFAPRGWAPCNGQLLSIAQNTALFSLLGVTYGGNGQTTFALPDLRGRVPIHAGGEERISLGQIGGTESHTLTTAEMPSHSHQVTASPAPADTNKPAGAIWAKLSVSGYDNTAPNAEMSPAAISPSGGSQPHNNMQPYLVIQYCIALEGIYPPRN